MSEPGVTYSSGTADHFCLVWPMPGTSLPVEINVCVLSINRREDECEEKHTASGGVSFTFSRREALPCLWIRRTCRGVNACFDQHVITSDRNRYLGGCGGVNGAGVRHVERDTLDLFLMVCICPN